VKTWLVTGGAGFIGSNFVLRARSRGLARIINLDLLTYAGNVHNLDCLREDPDHVFVRGDIGDRDLIGELLGRYRPDAVLNFAAESHVDRSIDGPDPFIQTNVVGTFTLLKEGLRHWRGLSVAEQAGFRFLHVSTDEVYGSLGPADPAFSECTPYAPSSPYSASKAAADHLVRAYHHTFDLPTLTTNCSNNYGPRQFPEKLIPLMILNALEGKSLPIYGDGLNVRDWLYVEDHCAAIEQVLFEGRPGEAYNIGGACELTNREVVRAVCGVLDELRPRSPYRPHDSLVTFVKDRPGHDRRYAIDSTKIRSELGWHPEETFETGLRKTVEWYLRHADWVQSIQSGEYQDWIRRQYGEP
jgi:dTDP-glucose 4,6-dehydratase